MGMHGAAKDDSVMVWFWTYVNGLKVDGRNTGAYLWVELKLNDGADVCFDVLREELETAVVVTNCDDLDDAFTIWAGRGGTFLSYDEASFERVRSCCDVCA